MSFCIWVYFKQDQVGLPAELISIIKILKEKALEQSLALMLIKGSAINPIFQPSTLIPSSQVAELLTIQGRDEVSDQNPDRLFQNDLSS